MLLIKRVLIGLVSLCILTAIGLLATGHGFILTSVQRTYLKGHTTANINDSEAFETREIKMGTAKSLDKHKEFADANLPANFLAQLESSGTAAFIVLKDGQVLTEHYFNGYDDRSKTNSFSMAKTVMTLLLGFAIEDGYVKGLDQPITDFIPEFADDPMGKHATIGQFSAMNSGYEWVEHYYSPFSPTVQLYYGDDITEFLTQGEFTAKAGEFWEYSSASTEIMGIFVLRALQKAGAANNLSEYLSNKVWQPLNMNDDALWHLDDAGMELVYCCINTNARNYAKLGQLMLNQGKWQGEQLISSRFINSMTEQGSQDNYGLSTWLNYENSPKFYWFSGHLGQSIAVVPDHNMVVVRLGEHTVEGEDFHTVSVPKYVEAAVELATSAKP